MKKAHKYDLRRRVPEKAHTGSEEESSAESSMDESRQLEGASADSMNAIIATLNALRASVEELRNSTVESQRDIIRLREEIQPQSVVEQVQPAQSEPRQVMSPQEEASQVVPATDVRVKLYDLPTFNGNVEEWPLFRANFDDTTAIFKYSNRQNLMRLQKCLMGPAKEAVASMLIYPNDVPTVLSELEFRFGRPDMLVKCQISKLQQFPLISETKPDQIVLFSSRVRNVVAFLKSAKCQQHLANVTLLEQMVGKLPQARQFDWARQAATIQPYPTVEDFSKWLSELARIACLMPTASTSSTRVNAPTANPRRLMHIERAIECYNCSGNHSVFQCEQFKKMGVQDRWELVKTLQLCFSCLRKGHCTLKCRSRKRCNVNGCQRYHNPLLHGEEAKTQPVLKATQTNETAQPILNCRLTQSTCGQLFKMLPVNIYGPNGKREVLAMFDEGSSISIMEEKVAKQIGAKGKARPLTLQWYDDKVVTEQALKLNIEIENRLDMTKFLLKDVFTVKELNLPEQSLQKEDFEHLKHLPLINYHAAKPVLLIGLKHAYLGATSTAVQAGIDSPIAIKTPLGWVAYGPTKSPLAVSPRVMLIKGYQQLQNLVEEYFATDSFGTNPVSLKLESEEDERARLILEQTTRRVGDQFECGLLWKGYPTNLPSSRAMAERRLMSVERQMKCNVEFGKRYRHEMAKYVDKGYARKLGSVELAATHQHVWYLPHFAVLNPHKPDKVRIVFDAAAMVDNVSLNSALLKGPEQAQPLIRILLQFRQGRVGVSADIREMFSQIRIRPSDQHAQRYLWRDGDASQPIEEYAMTSLIFGAVCSPCIAEHVKNKNAEDFRAELPAAASAIITKHYVDDLVASFDTPQQAVKISREIVHIHMKAGFELRNFISNCIGVEESMNQTSPAVREAVSMERGETTDKVLGLFWNTNNDTFEFHTKFHRVPKEVLDGTRAPTKRELLRIVMAVFDPFGMLADYLLFTKILIQETWKHGIAWDDVLPQELSKKWVRWWQEFHNVQQFKMQRCYSPYIFDGGRVEVHIFVDASQVAFAAAGYVRVVHGSEIDVSFIIGKTRTAPAKLLSVPRLELQAAVLGARLAKMIRDCLEFTAERVIFWSDSQTVLQWLNSSKRKYRAFVAHRIAEILSTTAQEQWRWVPTCHNPADVATRSSNTPKFDNNSCWVKGPAFLKLDEEYWPTTTVNAASVLPEEVKSDILLLVQPSNTLIDFSKFNSFSKLKRTIAWVIRAATLFRAKPHAKSQPPSILTAAELQKAEYTINRTVQRECFPSEIADLTAARKLAKQSSLYKLSPYLDEDGLLRLSGRIDEASYLPFQARRPILLPRKHIWSDLIVQHCHEKSHHQNSAITINEVRQKYWIPGLKTLLKAIQRKCLVCKIDRAQPSPPMMGQLPVDRITPFVRPFTFTGVDLFGPFNVSIGRRHEKRWSVIFTCLTVRAAHIELAENLSTDAFILCLRNFVNRRGTPVRIRSDNGTNFIGAQKDLKSCERLLDTDRIQAEAAKHSIEWVFNCPANPSSGGCWERLIRVVKSLLAKTLREVAPKVDTLQSVLIEAENIINSRPLTDVPVLHEDDEPLTPNHFLLGCANSTQTPYPADDKVCLRKQWRISQNLKDRLWKRWTTEYLPQLIQRTKWQEKTTPLKVNDLVIICDPAQPRSQWQRGRVTKVFPTKDGQVRVAEVKTITGVLRRPATRLAKLTIGESRGDSRGEGC
ncbi:uncharacterized protein LOC118756578 [Rhagoletis pomonella]|uniref:uncharacterized protein LOC118756578 n=1 Tax=Rhagoletis pomonella TaxID=28610 RepID=UPI00178063DB|nr:uncharacterized protein LOC118756578 [Rhagoletis pomonella]